MILEQVRAQIGDCRKQLDEAMYHSGLVDPSQDEHLAKQVDAVMLGLHAVCGAVEMLRVLLADGAPQGAHDGV